MLRIEKIHKTFDPNTVNERKALVDINLELAPGDFVTIIGSNGAGKSTLLNVISGAVRPDSGSVLVDGKNIAKLEEHERARYMARVFQNPGAGTAPHMTIAENLAMALERAGRRGLRKGVTKAKRARFQEELRMLELGLEDRLDDWVGLLSGGQRQALSLLMATFSDPDILLLDEHTAALDPQRAELVSRLTEQIVARHNLTTIMVTHNMDQALNLGNRLVMMHDGQIVRDVTPERKAQLTVQRVLEEFNKFGMGIADRTLLS
jgi:putative ABC transport system ATP-binding protein